MDLDSVYAGQAAGTYCHWSRIFIYHQARALTHAPNMQTSSRRQLLIEAITRASSINLLGLDLSCKLNIYHIRVPHFPLKLQAAPTSCDGVDQLSMQTRQFASASMRITFLFDTPVHLRHPPRPPHLSFEARPSITHI